MCHRITLFTLTVCLFITASARAVQFGWQALPDGGIEYIVEVEPDLLDAFRGEGHTSDLPPGLRDVRRVRFVIGEKQLPNQNDANGPLPAPPPARSNQPTTNETAAPAADAKSDPTAATAPKPAAGNGGLSNSIPFFHQEPARNTNGAEAKPIETSRGGEPTANDTRQQPTGGAVPTAGMFDTTGSQNGAVSSPKITEDEVQRDAAKLPLESPAPKPWLALMGALLLLFASLGANVYLVWIHQAVRAKYRSLVQRMPSELAAG